MAITKPFFGYNSDPGEEVYPSAVVELGASGSAPTIVRHVFNQHNLGRVGIEQVPFMYSEPGPASLRLRESGSIVKTDSNFEDY